MNVSYPAQQAVMQGYLYHEVLTFVHFEGDALQVGSTLLFLPSIPANRTTCSVLPFQLNDQRLGSTIRGALFVELRLQFGDQYTLCHRAAGRTTFDHFPRVTIDVLHYPPSAPPTPPPPANPPTTPPSVPPPLPPPRAPPPPAMHLRETHSTICPSSQVCLVYRGEPSVLRFKSAVNTGRHVSPVPWERDPQCRVDEHGHSNTCCEGAEAAAMDQLVLHNLNFKLTNLSVVLRLDALEDHRLCVATDASLAQWRPTQLRLVVRERPATYSRPRGFAGFVMTSIALPLGAGASTVVCILLIGHHHRGHLFSLSHPLRLPFVLAKKGLEQCSKGNREMRWEGQARATLIWLEAGVASGLAMWSVQGSIAVSHHAWYHEDNETLHVRMLVVLGLLLPVAVAFLFLVGLFTYGALRAPEGQFINKSTLTEHYAATASLVLLSLLGMQLFALLPWKTEFAGLPNRCTFDVFFLLYVPIKLLAFSVALLYSLQVYEVKSNYLTALYGLELAHGLVAKAMLRLGHCGEDKGAGSGLAEANRVAEPADISSDEKEMRMARMQSDETAAAGNAIVRNHARHFIASQRKQETEPEFITWIHELHPENCNPQFVDTEGIDPRIHAAGSNFRCIWAEALSLQYEGADHETVARLQGEMLRLQTELRETRWRLIGLEAPPAIVSDEEPVMSDEEPNVSAPSGADSEGSVCTAPAMVVAAGIGLTLVGTSRDDMITEHRAPASSVHQVASDDSGHVGAPGTSDITDTISALSGVHQGDTATPEPLEAASPLPEPSKASSERGDHSSLYQSRLSRARSFRAAGSRASMAATGGSIVPAISMDPRNPSRRTAPQSSSHGRI